MGHNNPGSIPPDLIVEYSGAPFSVVQKIKQFSAQQQQSAQQAEQQKAATEQQFEMAKLENQKYIAVINNLTKLLTSDKKIEADVIKLMLSSINEKENLAVQHEHEQQLAQQNPNTEGGM